MAGQHDARKAEDIPLVGFRGTFIIVLPLQLVDQSFGRETISFSRECKGKRTCDTHLLPRTWSRHLGGEAGSEVEGRMMLRRTGRNEGEVEVEGVCRVDSRSKITGGRVISAGQANFRPRLPARTLKFTSTVLSTFR